MFLPEHNQEQQTLSNIYFTKEFQGFEVESKWKLPTENPVSTLLQFMSDIHAGFWYPFSVAKAMGKLPVGLRYFELQFDFWATQNDPNSSHAYRQVAMVAKVPGVNMYQVAFKDGGSIRFLCDGQGFLNPPLVRREERKGNWVSEREAITLIKNRFPRAEKVASITRQKCYVYVHNIKSYRNFSISADLCHYNPRTLSQVEVEYKGRSGVWLPDSMGRYIALDFELLHTTLSERYGKILLPTTQTKFEWIMEG